MTWSIYIELIDVAELDCRWAESAVDRQACAVSSIPTCSLFGPLPPEHAGVTGGIAGAGRVGHGCWGLWPGWEGEGGLLVCTMLMGGLCLFTQALTHPRRV